MEVLREQKCGLENRVQVPEGLRTKVARLEAEIEDGNLKIGIYTHSIR